MVNKKAIILASLSDIKILFRSIRILKFSEDNIISNTSYDIQILDNIPNSVFVLEVSENGSFKIKEANKLYLRILNKKKRSELIGKYIEDIVPQSLARQLNEVYSECLKKKKIISYEEEIQMPDNEKRHYLTTLTPVVDDSNQITTIVGSSIEITDRKRMEQALQKSEEKYRSFVQNSSEGIYLFEFTEPFDTRLPITEQIKNFYKLGYVSACNDALAEMYGFDSIDEIIGRKLADFHGSENDPKHVKFLTTLINSGYQIKDELSIEKDKYGNTKYFSENIIGVVENNLLLRLWASQRDVTEQKKSEEKLKESLLEKKTLLSEIHHRVKNNLAVVSGLMQLQAFDTFDESLKAKLYDSVFRIKTMATVHELLYQSQSFANLEFSDTLKKLVENISSTLQNNGEVKLEIDCSPIQLTINQAIPASLIVNEVLTNTYKHAFKKKENGHIHFKLSEAGDNIIIEITDNGVGFPKDVEFDHNNSLGMHLIEVLSSQINASYEYRNNPDNKGTYFSLKFKRSNPELIEDSDIV